MDRKLMRQRSKKFRKIRNRSVLVALALAITFYFSSSQQITHLERVQEKGELVMLTVPGPTTYFEDGRGGNGFDYFIAKAFAESLGVELRVQSKLSLRNLLVAVGGPQGDFAAANLVRTEERSQSLRFSAPYLEVTQQLLYRRGTPKPESLSDIDGDLLVITSSSHSEQLKKISVDVPQLNWREQDEIEMGDLIRMVHTGEIDYTVVDSISYLVNRHIYPNAGLAIDISEPQMVAWAFPSHEDGSLLNAANKFLTDYITSGQMERLKEQLLAQSNNFSVADSKRLGELVAKRLPAYELLFRQTAAENNLNWHLLAAVAYQESHWNPRAKSPTGVRGLMMLTLNTAKEMGVSNRLDANQSIKGGAAYLAKLRARLPARITEPDRTFLALAAYNVGFGHLEDARILTQRGGKNPDSWEDVRQYLPLLSKKKFYSTLKYGYARGAEPVLYVSNIKYYRNYLELYSLHSKDLPLEETNDSESQPNWESNSLPSI
ncbi:MAG: membrane-bound lytic murein transglycosylase F [Porticoccaceae bacterium]|jgi:membrane-bound lytic murein transglycosylase F